MTVDDMARYKRLWLSTALSALLLALPFTEAMAQIAEVQPGARIRLRAPGVVAGRYTGVVLSRSAD